MSVLDGVHKVLVAHAHPDDESLDGGSLLVRMAQSGIEVVLLTASRGEQGEVVPGPLSHLAGTPELMAQRERELAGAVEVLGIARSYFLGTPPARALNGERRYEDSGMRWIRPGLAGPGDSATADSLTSADATEAEADLIALLRHEGPDLLITYDADGGYGHPDHVRLHELAVAAGERTGTPLAVLTHQRDAPGVEWFEDPQLMPVVFDALRHHATQVSVDPPYVVHSGGQREQVASGVGLRRVLR